VEPLMQIFSVLLVFLIATAISPGWSVFCHFDQGHAKHMFVSYFTNQSTTNNIHALYFHLQHHWR
jgi:hypothetical protein